ncbi:hypothetical protein BDA99DRAFT_540787 [Phascolomyces articulosus]|uniref:Heterokaryon incompatibility domain-containing protein n=1 Tax=Phascolomyces articulosus TaxID=60185 RepID=A0AAD5JTU7_9FUNG|nr:hypothetical protein BDA99DRAFT_540787 [Phascolomyces articulosus]
MYITYKTAQYKPDCVLEYDKYYNTRDSQLLKKIPNDLPKPNFMPSKLVRISDMTVVYGSQVNEGYCALSYSWNQSGDIQRDDHGKYTRIDEGKHKIISYDNFFPCMIFSRSKVAINYDDLPFYEWRRLEKIYHVLKIVDDKNYYFTKTIQYVKFEGIIQQICQQFNIKYIWYDQLCINQDDKEEKQLGNRNSISNVYGP